MTKDEQWNTKYRFFKCFLSVCLFVRTTEWIFMLFSQMDTNGQIIGIRIKIGYRKKSCSLFVRAKLEKS